MNDDLTTLDMAPLDQILEEYAGQKGAVIPILQHAQEAYGYLPKEVLMEISRRTGIPVSRLMEGEISKLVRMPNSLVEQLQTLE